MDIQFYIDGASTTSHKAYSRLLYLLNKQGGDRVELNAIWDRALWPDEDGEAARDQLALIDDRLEIIVND